MRVARSLVPGVRRLAPAGGSDALRVIAAGLLLVTLATVVPTMARAASHSITDLGTLPGGSYSIANDVNDSGQIVGISDSATIPA
jgi:uncharacterized membrane protein